MADRSVEAITGVTPAPVLSTSRARTLLLLTAPTLAALAIVGSLIDGPTGSIAYAASLGAAALIVLVVAAQRGHQARAWRWIGIGLAIWAATGILVTVKWEAGFTPIPDLLIDLGYAAGYVPCIVGFAELADPQQRLRRWTGFVDGFILFLGLYAVLWLVVVEPVAFDSGLTHLDRAFSSLYPAGDLALVMLAVRVLMSRAARRDASVLLLVGASLSAIADTALLVLYLIDPDNESNITDLFYLSSLAVIALAAILSLQQAPPPTARAGRSTPKVSVAMASAALLPAVVLLGVVVLTDRDPEVAPIGVWLILVVCAMVVRNMTAVRDLARVHDQALWFASHDPASGMLLRGTFMHDVNEGDMRQRSGVVAVVEIENLAEIADADDSVGDAVVHEIAERMQTAMGRDGAYARLSPLRLVGFLRSADLGRGREAGRMLERMLAEPVTVGSQVLHPQVAIGIAQADGVVIDVPAGVRRATAAMRVARSERRGRTVFDADLASRRSDPSPPARVDSAERPVAAGR